MAVEDTFTYEPPADRDVQLRHTIENYDEQLDELDWELENEMDPKANWPNDVAQNGGAHCNSTKTHRDS